MFAFLFQLRIRKLGRSFVRMRAGQVVTALLFLLVILLVALGVYALLYYGLREMAKESFLVVALPLFIYEIFLLVVSILVFASSLITGLFRLFRGGVDFWVLGSPKYAWFLADQFLSILLVSLWPLVVIAIPAVLAITVVFHVGILGFLLAFISIFLLGIVMVALALFSIVALGFVVRFVGKFIRIYGFAVLATFTVLLFVGLMALLWLRLRGINMEALFNITDLELAQAGATDIIAKFTGMPSTFAAQVFSAVQTGALAAASYAFFWLLLLTLVSTALLFSFSRAFLRLWQYFAAGSLHRGLEQSRNVSEGALPEVTSVFPEGATQAILKKEWLAMIRDGRDILWFGFLALLWVLVTGLDFFMRSSFESVSLGELSGPEVVQVLQLLIIVYFAAAFVLRFVFPSFSSERDTAWVMFGSPVDLRRIFFAKALFFSTVLVLLSFGIGLVHMSILHGAVGSSALFIAFGLFETLILSIAGLSFGILFPNFETTDPQELSTTLSGLTFTFGALAYGALGSLAYYLTVSTGLWWGAGIFLIFSILLVAFLARRALGKLPKMEFEAVLES